MTFESEDVRHQYHQLPTQLQHVLNTAAARAANMKVLFHVSEVIGSEVVIRIHESFEVGLSSPEVNTED